MSFTLIFQKKYFTRDDVIHPQPRVLFQRKIFWWWFDHVRFVRWLFRKIPLIVLGDPIQKGDCWEYPVKVKGKKWRIK